MNVLSKILDAVYRWSKAVTSDLDVSFKIIYIYLNF